MDRKRERERESEGKLTGLKNVDPFSGDRVTKNARGTCSPSLVLLSHSLKFKNSRRSKCIAAVTMDYYAPQRRTKTEGTEETGGAA